MGNKTERKEQAAALRRQAEKVHLKRKLPSTKDQAKPTPGDTLRTLHELRVHQIELEMQNEELQRTQTALDAQRARYFDLYDLAPVGYLTISAPGLILEANLTAAALLGTVRGALAKRPASQFVMKDDQDIFYLHCKKLLLTREPQACELRLLKKDGTAFWAQLLATAGEAGGAPEIHLTISDINARKRAELEKEKLNAALTEQKKEMENFLYITSHDMRGPLLNIQGYGQNLEKDLKELSEAAGPGGPPEKLRLALDKLSGERIPAALSYIAAGALKMDRIISSLLKVSRQGRVEMRPAALNAGAVLKNILDEQRFLLEEAAGLVKTGALPPCTADADALGHIFTNLVENAVKYRDKGRKLLITVEGGRNSSTTVLYTVADNGLGIKAAELPRIWQLFYSGDKAGPAKGEGIGLTMARRIAEANSGKLWAESKEGEGSTFFLELPA